MKQMVQLGSNVLSKLKEMLKRTCKAESCQTKIVNKSEEAILNPNTTVPIPLLLHGKYLPEANAIRQKPQRSPICSPNLKMYITGKSAKRT